MFTRILIALIGLALMGALLLEWRQQRIELTHQMTRTHIQMDQSRRAIWDAQVRIAEQLDPEAFRRKLERASLSVHPDR